MNDNLTPLLEKRAATEAKASGMSLIGNGMMDGKEFRYLLNMDGSEINKPVEGIRAFISEAEKLEEVIAKKVRALS